jgi:hypothetical protein
MDYIEKLQRDIGEYPRIEQLSAILGPATSEGDYELSAYIRLDNDDIFTIWAVTPGLFVFFEVLPTKEYINVAIPLSRISRVVEASTGGVYAVTVEYDADVATTRYALETASQVDVTSPDPSNPITRGIVEGITSTPRVIYRLTSPLDDAARVAQLHSFVVAFRGLLR